MRYYIAYGSNLNVAQMTRRCPDARIVGTSFIEGYRLLFKGSQSGAYLTIEKSEGHKVPVGIWCVSEDDERELDRYEGFPTFYYKKEFTLSVRMKRKAKELNCFAYIMDEQRPLGIPSDCYVEICERGYWNFMFDRGYLYDALDYSIKNKKSLLEGFEICKPQTKKN